MSMRSRSNPHPLAAGDEQRSVRMGNSARSVVPALLAAVVAGIVAAGILASSASAVERLEAVRAPTEASVEVFVEPVGWTPEERGWPPEEAPALGGRQFSASGVLERADLALNGRPHGMSVEQIAALVGVPAEFVTGITLGRCLGYCSDNPKHEKLLSLSRNEALGKNTSQAPYLQAEEVAGMSALSFVMPPEGPHPESTVSSGPNGVLVMVLTIEGALLQLAPISFSPAEPTAGMPVEFAQPRAVGGLQGALPVTLRWTFGDGTTSTEAAPKHVYIPVAQNGTTRYAVSVEVVVRNSKGEEIAAGTQVVTVTVKSMEAAKPTEREPTGPTGITPIPAPPPTPTRPAPPPAPALHLRLHLDLQALTRRKPNGRQRPPEVRRRRPRSRRPRPRRRPTGRPRLRPVSRRRCGPLSSRMRSVSPTAIASAILRHPSRSDDGCKGTEARRS